MSKTVSVRGIELMLINKDIEFKLVTDEHHPFLAEWFKEPVYWGNFLNMPPFSKESVKEMLDSFKESQWYLIYDRKTGKPMGVIASFNPYGDGYFGAEIGYVVHQDSRKLGVATKAASMLIDHLFDTSLVPRIIANIVVGNNASRRVVEKAGMSLEGIERRKYFLNGKFVDMWLFSIIRDDWVSPIKNND